MKVTDKEFAVLTAIALNDYNEYNGSMPENHTHTSTWSNQLCCGKQVAGYPIPAAKGFGGVIASLTKKGLVIGDGGYGEDACVAHTEEGFRVWRELYEARANVAQAV